MPTGRGPILKARTDPSVGAGTDRIQDVTGVILAGGRSSRYGKNKALEKIEGLPLIERVLGVMGAIFHRVIIITNTPEEYAYLGTPMFGDLIQGLGPLGGIHTGLRKIHDPAGFFVACDMPFLNPDLIRYLAGFRSDFDVVAPCISGRIEALHSLYTRRCGDSIEELIRTRTYQVFRFFPSVSVRFVVDNEIRRWDPDLRSLLNINTPDELKRLGKHPTRPAKND